MQYITEILLGSWSVVVISNILKVNVALQLVMKLNGGDF